ncbi:hypothetical protein AAFX26_15820 (plasmid) [Vibrio alginolyticus]|uniref:hypothetical protein n=1 Tax=Vibrio alginolyticus TaxID=663 RepID=UPI00168CF766|nr:hypothetical protein [Vibrio alginolyticus]ELH9641297.1 hypothetical protein [Vibrio alginolyticus]
MAKRKRNKQAKQMLENLILGGKRLYWIGERSEIYVGDSLDAIVAHFRLENEAYDPVYGAAFGPVNPWSFARDEYREGEWRECTLISLCVDAGEMLDEPYQLTSCEY